MTIRKAPVLGILFVLAVLLPSVILAVIAMRAASSEEAYIERQWKTAVLTEVTHAVSVLSNTITSVEASLDQTVPFPSRNSARARFATWKEATPYVKTTFLLSKEKDILWPDPKQRCTEDEISFLNWNEDFVKDRIAVPVYENIAIAFQDIINEPDSWSNSNMNEMAAQKALDRFEESPNIRKKVYKQAEEQGMYQLARNTQEKNSADKQAVVQESMYAAKARFFGEIVGSADRGIVPRMIEEKLSLLFWKKNEQGTIAGCIIDRERFEKELVDSLPLPATNVRVMTVLDENGFPLVAPSGNPKYEWKLPFVSREISGFVPRWEVAAYLVDPRMIETNARTTSVIILVLVVIMIISIAGGGAVVIGSAYGEIRLARKKTSFVANVSHELKTPLTSIRLFAEMLLENRQPDESKRRQYLSNMVRETERLSRLIGNVLDFSKMGQGTKVYRRKETNLIDFIRRLTDGEKLRLEQAGFSVRFSVSTASGPQADMDENECVMVNIDEEAIAQAVLNLISNAEKYSVDGREIDMCISPKFETVELSVSDRGPGIPAKYADKIFREFFRIDDSLTAKTRGSGLGLSIAKRIVEDHGGTLVYRTRDGGGSTFVMVLKCVGVR
jgi:signal transduction histidine kinase